jgi:hypothetical protein
MKITAPLDKLKEVVPLIEAGAEELYCGVFSKNWRQRRSYPNARSMISAQLDNPKDLEKALKITKRHSVPVFLCTNSYLGKGAFESLLEDISFAINSGVDGFIIADLDLVPFIRKLDKNSKIILSCMNACFNSQALEFFAELGVNRIVLDRQLTLDEIRILAIDAKLNKVELEVFIKNIVCRNVNANCLYYRMLHFFPASGMRKYLRSITVNSGNMLVRALHTSSFKIQPCREKFNLEVFKKENDKFIRDKRISGFSLDPDFARYCAVCSTYYLEKFNIAAVKIIGRGFLTQKKIKDVRFLKRYLEEINKDSVTEDNFLWIGKRLYRQVYGEDCSPRQCHHWEVYQHRKNKAIL